MKTTSPALPEGADAPDVTDRQAAVMWMKRAEQAESERDTALARVKELEERGAHVNSEVVRICGEREEMGRRAQAAESALASALARVAEVTEQRDLWAKQCNMASEAQADAASKLSTALAALKAGTSREVVAHAETLGKLRALELDREEFTQRDAAERMRLVKLVQELEAKNESLREECDLFSQDKVATEATLTRSREAHGLTIKRCTAAESALASARDIVTRCLDEIDCDIYDDPCVLQLVAMGRDWLSSHPSPAPCYGCAAARELLVLWYHNRAWTESGELIEVETQNWLKEHLAIVPAAAVPTPEERQVLEACAAAEVVMLSNGWRMLDGNSNRSVVEAELARRAARKEKP